jgi:uncharacterized protein
MSGDEHDVDFERYLRIDAAFKAGDLDALRQALDDPNVVPNGPMPSEFSPCLTYAVYDSPLDFIRTLLDLGADPNADDGDGFPPLIAALHTRRAIPGATPRRDGLEMIRLLVARGADIHQRGLNDYTPLHLAVDLGDDEAVEVLLALGADPSLRTRIDQRETPRDLAIRGGHGAILARLSAAGAGRHPSPLPSDPPGE